MKLGRGINSFFVLFSAIQPCKRPSWLALLHKLTMRQQVSTFYGRHLLGLCFNNFCYWQILLCTLLHWGQNHLYMVIPKDKNCTKDIINSIFRTWQTHLSCDFINNVLKAFWTHKLYLKLDMSIYIENVKTDNVCPDLLDWQRKGVLLIIHWSLGINVTHK